MAEKQLFLEGVNLMFSGMGFVLIFLLILVWAIQLMSVVINRFLPAPEQAEPQPVKTIQSTTPPDDSERLRPVIVAAIAHYRRSQGLN